ncbi:hypothetical protein QCE62_25695 [Caballeronia sp. LZ033]|uniref:hypothetical protein n=1 Tax=Caballeronia sp. LZ033 TaxID=3038566 RepID=UPI002863CBAD|nr:hypothetical protein [Caballeronia sp. LZ033]MDR5816996.1 hypothetical protein [Caballeronia sp. LZ033]
MHDQPSGNRGQRLLGNLRRLFGGNHCNPADIQSVAEENDAYRVSAFVSWQFHHSVTTQSCAGNAAVKGGHFDYRTGDFQAHLQRLFQQAQRDRAIRGPFMQRVDAARKEALAWSNAAQPVHDFGAWSVFRQCGTCAGRGQVRCGGCGGAGKSTCGGCGGAGGHNRTVTHTRWNGRNNETCSQHIRERCVRCLGGGRVVCTGCGGSGHRQCGSCAGHGFFTDVSRVQAVARPVWSVPAATGLAGDALAASLRARGSAGAPALVALDLCRTGYDERDNWVVQYDGTAEVVALELTVLKQRYRVAAAGAVPVPIVTPPVFDQLLSAEMARLAAVATGKRGQAQVQRQAKALFAAFRAVPVLDAGLRAVAKLDRKGPVEPASAIVGVAEGFISPTAAEAFGRAACNVLDKVSPTHSHLAWSLVALVPAGASFLYAARLFNHFSLHAPWSAVLPFFVTLIGALCAMLIVSPAGWLLSSLVSYAWRLRVPREYRQRVRNWAPLKRACGFTMAMSLTGVMVGLGGALGWLPTVPQAAQAATGFVVGHTEPGSMANRYLIRLAAPRADAPAPVPLTHRETLQEVQRILISRKILRGDADGRPGPRTSAAISDYERREHLPPTLSTDELLMHMRRTGAGQ